MKLLRKLSAWVGLGTLALVMASGCGDDDDDNGGPGGSSGSGATSSNAGEGNGAGTSNIAGSPGNAGEPSTPTGGTNSGGSTSTPEAGAFSGGAPSGGLGEGGAGGAAILSLSDAQILLVLDTLNAGEVEEAYAALPRLSDADVEAFAQQMITHHGAARQEVAATAETLELSPAPSEKAAALKGKSESHVALLRGTSQGALDTTYIDLQVSMHLEALNLLNELGDVADAEALTALIASLEGTVQDHYDEATSLREQLP